MSADDPGVRMELHPQLCRQLRRSGVDAQALEVPRATLGRLLELVGSAYTERDQDRYLMERAQDLASAEMAALYGAVRTDRDLLEQRVQERTEALRVSEARLSSLLSLSVDWFWETDTDLVLSFVSEGIAAAAGIQPDEMVARARLTGPFVDAPQDGVAAYEACLDARQAFREFTFGHLRNDGVKRYIRISGEPMFEESGNFRGYRGVGRDVTQMMQTEQRIYELARFDSLTGLPNRNMFLGELDRAIARARRHEMLFAVCFIDLDHFKVINDTLGHQAGDELLRTKAHQLRDTVRKNDLVARMGGDEFVVLLEGSTDPASIGAVADKVLAVLSLPTSMQGSEFVISGSIGIARFPDDGEDAAALLKHADAAMYQAKSLGKNKVHFYTADLTEHAVQKRELESALRHAIGANQLLLHFQPKMNVADNRMVGMEALVRWMHPTRGLVPPMDFIPLAEERGLIVPLGRWVIDAVCRQIHDWRAAGVKVPPVAFNLSARQFSSESLFDDLQHSMARFGISPADLEVELTESVLMNNPDRASAVLEQFNAMGLRISIDDFGTGYSSLSYLKRFPAQTVKIDRSFIRGLATDANDQAITRAVIGMAHSLGLSVVAEGVEDNDQLQMLRAMGCDEVQGYLMGRPMTSGDLQERIGTSVAPAEQLAGPKQYAGSPGEALVVVSAAVN